MGKKTKADPTGQAVNRRKATLQLQRRFTSAEREVKRLFRAIPRKRRREAVLPNADSLTVYDYQSTATELEVLERQIRATIDEEVPETQADVMPPNWWWQSVIELPYRQGTAEEVVEFNALIAAAAVALGARGLRPQPLEIGQVLQSSEYRDALEKVYVQNFGSIKGLSDRTADQVVGVINRGMSAGKTPTEIAKEITERFDVSRSSAQRLADTEVNKAYNDGRLDATDIAAKQTGLRAGVLHVSALLPTTRQGHADRHGNAYTVAHQRQWWDTGANRINCHCTTRTVLIDRKGDVIDVAVQDELQAEREFFDD